MNKNKIIKCMEEEEFFPECFIKEYKKDSLFKKMYENIGSNKQIKALFKISKDDINIYNRLISLLGKRIPQNEHYKIRDIIKKNNNDDTIYSKIKELYMKNKKYVKPSNIVCSRSEILGDIYTSKIQKLVGKNKIKNYLDIGCGNGKVTAEVGKKLGLKKENIFGTDFDSFNSQKYNRTNVNMTYKPIEGNKYPFRKNSMDLVTIVNVLHHVDDFSLLLDELKRILKKDGMIMIIEPDVYDYSDIMLVDVEHQMYPQVYNNEETKITENNNYVSKYYLNMLFQDKGFEFNGGEYLSRSVKFELYPNREFYAIYK
jgi:ubiquinone/menaquinone biosynthesis C-methylase UbiE